MAVVLAAALSGCSAASSSSPAPAAAPSPTPAQPQSAYERAVLADGPVGFWPLRDATSASTSVSDLVPGKRPARVVDGPLRTTTGPVLGSFRTTAVTFDGAAHIRTRVRTPFQPGHPFTVEMLFRADACTERWTQVVGTGTFGEDGRGGVNFLHYPRGFQTECHLAVEFWGQDRYAGGCGTREPTVAGKWILFATTFDGRVARCYVDGHEIGLAAVGRYSAGDRTPFGIGASGDRYAGAFDSGSLAGVVVYDRALDGNRLMVHAAAVGR